MSEPNTGTFEINGKVWQTDSEMIERLRDCRDKDEEIVFGWLFAAGVASGRISEQQPQR